MLIPKIVMGFVALALVGGICGTVLNKMGYNLASVVAYNIGILAILPALLFFGFVLLMLLKESGKILLLKINKKP